MTPAAMLGAKWFLLLLAAALLAYYDAARNRRKGRTFPETIGDVAVGVGLTALLACQLNMFGRISERIEFISEIAIVAGFAYVLLLGLIKKFSGNRERTST